MKCPNCNTEVSNDEFELFKLKLEERKMLITSAHEGANTFDKAILTLTSGAFGLSFVFLKDIVPSPKIETLHLLSMAWLFFSVSLIIILVSFLTSHKACYFAIEQTFKEKKEEQRENYWSTVTWICNIVSILCLAFAFIFMGYFFYSNVVSKYC